MNEEFIAKLLAELFDFPCNFSPCEEELHNSEEKRTVFGAKSIAINVMQPIVGCTILKSSTRR